MSEQDGWYERRPLKNVWDVCEYCGRGDVVLYAWHADTWCADCIGDHPSLKMTGTVAEAPIGRPEHATYEQPFVWQRPDGHVVAGEVRGDSR